VTIELLYYIINFYFRRDKEEDVTKKEDKKVDNIHCSICYVQSMNSPEMKFHLYDEDNSYCANQDKHICQKCLDWIHFTRKMASEQAKKPETNPFDDVSWWCEPKKEDISAAEMKVK